MISAEFGMDGKRFLFKISIMNNPYEDWDEYDWQDHISKRSHEHFLTTPNGKQWEKDKKRAKEKENFKYFILILIGIIILLLIIRVGGCNYHSSSEPYRR